METILVKNTIGIPYYIWNGIKNNKLKPSKFDNGRRVWVAGDEEFEEKYIKSYHIQGEPGWKKTGFILETEFGYEQAVYDEQIIIHPSDIYES